MIEYIKIVGSLIKLMCIIDNIPLDQFEDSEDPPYFHDFIFILPEDKLVIRDEYYEASVSRFNGDIGRYDNIIHIKSYLLHADITSLVEFEINYIDKQNVLRLCTENVKILWCILADYIRYNSVEKEDIIVNLGFGEETIKVGQAVAILSYYLSGDNLAANSTYDKIIEFN